MKLVRTAKRNKNIIHLMVYREIIYVFLWELKKNILCLQNVKCLKLKLNEQ
jgi:hypothetical protein